MSFRHRKREQREAGGLEIDLIDHGVVQRLDGLHVDVVSGDLGGFRGGVHVLEGGLVQRQVDDLHVVLALGAQALGQLAAAEGDVHGHRALGLHFIPFVGDDVAQVVLLRAAEREVVQQGVVLVVGLFLVGLVQGFHVGVIVVGLGGSGDRRDKQLRVVGGVNGILHRDDGIYIGIGICIFGFFEDLAENDLEKGIFGQHAGGAVRVGIDPGGLIFAVGQRSQLLAVQNGLLISIVFDVQRQRGVFAGEGVFALGQGLRFKAAHVVAEQVDRRVGNLDVGIIRLRHFDGDRSGLRLLAADGGDRHFIRTGHVVRPLKGAVLDQSADDEAVFIGNAPLDLLGFGRLDGEVDGLACGDLLMIRADHGRREGSNFLFAFALGVAFQFILAVGGFFFPILTFDSGLFFIIENILRICRIFDFGLFFLVIRIFDLRRFGVFAALLVLGIARIIGLFALLAFRGLLGVIHRFFRRIRIGRRCGMLLLLGFRCFLRRRILLCRFRLGFRRLWRRCRFRRSGNLLVFLFDLDFRGERRRAAAEVHHQHHDRAQHSENSSALHVPDLL